MSRIRIESFSLSLDGYGAGPAQALQGRLVDQPSPPPAHWKGNS